MRLSVRRRPLGLRFPLALAVTVLTVSAASGLEIKYTPFYPDRMVSARSEQMERWGPHWQWPLKTFPDEWRMPQVADLGDSYGLVYIPGETVDVHLVGDGDPVDRVTCTNVLNGSTLPVRFGKTMRPIRPEEMFSDLRATRPGLLCEAFMHAGFPKEGETPEVTKVVPRISLDASPRKHNVALRFRGFFRVKKEDEYAFSLKSDDGSRLYVDGRLVVNTSKGPVRDAQTGSARLKAGTHLLVVEYWQGGGGSELEVAWDLPAPDRRWRKWEIPIPEREGDEPYLAVYRVRALRGDREVASRGLIVTRPWSGMTVHGDPDGLVSSRGRVFHEWHGGIVSPSTRMCLFYGNHTYDDSVFPKRNRPWRDVGAHGLAEFYSPAWPRSGRWEELCGGTEVHTDRGVKRGFTSEGYKDPTLEWHPWWTYFSRGVSKWHGEWQWGPFCDMSIENHVAAGYAYDVCYSDIKKYCAAYPNGLLFWQWQWPGLKRLHMHLVKFGERGAEGKPVVFACSDGWAANSLPFAMKRWLRYNQEVGMMALYYDRCRHQGRDTSWTDEYNAFGRFMAEQMADAIERDNKTNDFCLGFGRGDLDTKGIALLQRAAREAYEAVTGKPATFFTRSFSALDFHPSGMLYREFRPVNHPFFSNLLTWTDTGGDYAHYVVGQGNDFYHDLREYRAYGLNGAMTCALFPECRYGYGYNLSNFEQDPRDLNNGAVMPGSRAWAERTIKRVYSAHHGEVYQRRLKYIDDGTSFRRFDLAERVPMYYRPDGSLVGRLVANTGAWVPSRIEQWNTQVLLGMQVMEIPDRTKPIGGVLILDSNNAEDRARSREFLTDHPFAGYVVAIMDALGVWTFANPDVGPVIPPDVARIYLPRKDGGDQAFLIAEVAGRRVRVPYTGEEMHDPSHPHMQRFITEVKKAYPGGWPIRTSGGFVATAWESSNGVFVYVENPVAPRRAGRQVQAIGSVEASSSSQVSRPEVPPAPYADEPVFKQFIANRPGICHPHRQGSVSVRMPGIEEEPAVIDLCGGSPDPMRLPDEAVRRDGEFITFDLEWARGDGRLYWIPVPTRYGDKAVGPAGRHLASPLPAPYNPADAFLRHRAPRRRPPPPFRPGHASPGRPRREAGA